MGRRVPLAVELRRVRPELEEVERAIEAGRVLVDGRVVSNPRSRVVPGCSIVVKEPTGLRGSIKLRTALDHFGVAVADRVCLDVGAAAGGFTTLLLERGAKRVYGVDVGHGQLLGSLRQNPRVVNLEATNVAELTTELIADRIDLVTIDVSYLSLASATVQLNRVEFAPEAELIGLVKPMFELKLSTAPTEVIELHRAIGSATTAISQTPWRVAGTMESPERGANGAIEGFVWFVRGD